MLIMHSKLRRTIICQKPSHNNENTYPTKTHLKYTVTAAAGAAGYRLTGVINIFLL